jgi:hypothetical protein
MKTVFIAMMAALVFTGCVKKVLAPREFISWVRDAENGLRVEKEIADHLFALQYKPAEYEVLMQARDEDISTSDFNAMKNEIDELQYFTLSVIAADKKELALSGTADEKAYAERANYMMAEMQEDFALLEGGDTLPCVFFHSERNFNLSPENHILLGFEKAKTNGTQSAKDKTLIYYDRLLDCGLVLLTIKAEDLQNLPELKLAE